MEQYLNTLEIIKKKGTYKPAARENMPGTQSLFGHQFRVDLSEGFPLLTTKKMFWKGVVIELLWFLRGDVNIKYLVDNGVNVWNEDAYNYYCKECKNQKTNNLLSFDVFVDIIKNSDKGLNELKYPEIIKDIDNFIPKNYSLGDCGFQYGKVWRGWEKVIHDEQAPDFENKLDIIDQIKNVLIALQKSPESRRHVVTAIDPAHENDLALYWCHALFQFNCRPLTEQQRNDYFFKGYEVGTNSSHEAMTALNCPKYYLDCHLYQRSADVFLGVPFNIASYALMTEIFAKICNMIPGDFIHTFGDVHIYDNHIDAVEEQLLRTPTKLPTLKIADEGNDWAYIRNTFDFSMLNLTDFIIEDYNPQASIKAELSTGLKK